jgi:hypothetical protein
VVALCATVSNLGSEGLLTDAGKTGIEGTFKQAEMTLVESLLLGIFFNAFPLGSFRSVLLSPVLLSRCETNGRGLASLPPLPYSRAL